MGNTPEPEPEPIPTSTNTRICVAGYSISGNYTRAANVAFKLSEEFPDQYCYWTYAPGRSKFFEWLPTFKARLAADNRFHKHRTSPICWFEKDGAITEVIGGRDDLCAWTIKNHPKTKAAELAEKWVNPFESDLTQQKTKK